MAASAGKVMNPLDIPITDGDVLLRFCVILQNGMGYIGSQFCNQPALYFDGVELLLSALGHDSIEIQRAFQLFPLGQGASQ